MTRPLAVLVLLVGCTAEVVPPPAEAPCADGEVVDERSEACVPTGCGAADFPSADGVHVAPWGDDADAGTADAPVASLEQGRALGSTLVLAEGTWPGGLRLDEGELSVLGRCPALTILDATDAEDAGQAALTMSAGTLHLQGLTLRGGLFGVQLQQAGASRLEARLEDVVVEEPRENGLLASGVDTEVTLRDVEIVSVRPNDEGRAAGLALFDGATLDARRLVVRDIDHLGVGVFRAGTRATIEDSWIGDVRWVEGDSQPSGIELAVQTGAVVELRGTELAGPGPIGGIAATNSRILAEDCTVRGHKDPWGMYGLAALGGEIEVIGGLVEDNQIAGLYAQSGTLTLDGVEVRGNHARFDGPEAAGIWLAGGSRLDAVGVDVHDNIQYGLVGYGVGNLASVTSSTVHHNLPDERGVFGVGVGMVCLEASCASSLTLDSVVVEANHHAGLRLSGPGIQASVLWGSISGTLPLPEHSVMGWGVVLERAAHLDLSGAEIADNYDVGVLVDTGATLSAVNSVVRDTQLLYSPGGGAGVAVTGEGWAELRDSMFTDNVGPGLYAAGGGAIDGENILVEGAGFAGVAVQGGSLTLRESDIQAVAHHPARGGGVGVFAWSLSGYEASVTLEGVAFQDLGGPALYVRDVWRVEADRITVARAGRANGVPGLLFAGEGVAAWNGLAGLRISDSAGSDLAGPGVVLDDSSAFIEGTTLDDIGGPPLFRQNCATSAEPSVDNDDWDTSCQAFIYDLGPPLSFDLGMHEVTVSR